MRERRGRRDVHLILLLRNWGQSRLSPVFGFSCFRGIDCTMELRLGRWTKPRFDKFLSHRSRRGVGCLADNWGDHAEPAISRLDFEDEVARGECRADLRNRAWVGGSCCPIRSRAEFQSTLHLPRSVGWGRAVCRVGPRRRRQSLRHCHYQWRFWLGSGVQGGSELHRNRAAQLRRRIHGRENSLCRVGAGRGGQSLWHYLRGRRNRMRRRLWNGVQVGYQRNGNRAAQLRRGDYGRLLSLRRLAPGQSRESVRHYSGLWRFRLRNRVQGK